MDKTEDLNTKWKIFNEILLKTTEEIVPKVTRKAKQQWMTKDILNLMEERRKAKLADLNKYPLLNKSIKEECRKAKEEWLNTECKEMEMNRGKENIHQKIKELSGRNKWVTSSNCIKSKEGQILTEEYDIKHRWEEYIEQLYHDGRKIKPITRNAEGPKILEVG